MFVRVAIVVMCALVAAAGCGGDRDSDREQTTSAQLCGMVTTTMLTDIFGGTFKDAEPFGPEHFPGCLYQQSKPTPTNRLGAHIDVRTEVHRKDSTSNPFADYYQDGSYEEVDGLGDSAAYGQPHGSYHVLLVINDVGDKDRFVEVFINPLAYPTLEQARPIAERVLDGLDA